MNGMEFKMILGFIIMLAVLAAVFFLAFKPATDYKDNSGEQLSFREFCVFWSTNGYDEGFIDPVVRGGKPHGSPSEFCPLAIGNPSQTEMSNIEKYTERCRNVCRGLA